jgi:protein-tyrosine phosphatase
MAEGMLRAALPGRQVFSAGLGALVGEAAAPSAIELLAERGVDISGHRARQLADGDIRGADLILVMETFQAEDLVRQAPYARGKVHLLGRWGGFEVPDPYRQPREAFERALALIDRGVGEWVERLGKL